MKTTISENDAFSTRTQAQFKNIYSQSELYKHFKGFGLFQQKRISDGFAQHIIVIFTLSPHTQQ